MENRFDICYVTAPDRGSADKITSALLEARLAACVSAVPGVKSAYRWEGRLETSEEILLVIKTRSGLRGEVVAAVKANHPYSVPEVLFTGVADGSPDYLRWLEESTSPAGDDNT